MITIIDDIACDRLIGAILEQAVDDYKKLLKHPMTSTRNKTSVGYAVDKYERMASHPYIGEIEEFFHSEWFATLTDVDPDYVIRSCKEVVKNGRRKSIRDKSKSFS